MLTGLFIAIAGVFVLTALIAGGATSWFLAHNAPERRRLRNISQSSGQGQTAPIAKLTEEDFDPILKGLSRLMPKSPKEMSIVQRRLTRAGYPRAVAAVYYSLAQLLLPVIFGGIVLLAFGVSSWLYAILAAALGYLTPGFYVGRKTAKRQKDIQNGLADALDLLTICVEAGSGLDQAIAKAADELELAHPAVAGELRLITTEVRAGKPRLEAFQNFSKRTGVEDVRSLVAMLTQTDRFGTSVGQALRTHAETIRTKRRQRAEERAAKVSVKMVFPLALFLFPALYVVCFGPVVVQIYHSFF
jgi:tight adherence protein C